MENVYSPRGCRYQKYMYTYKKNNLLFFSIFIFFSRVSHCTSKPYIPTYIYVCIYHLIFIYYIYNNTSGSALLRINILRICSSRSQFHPCSNIIFDLHFKYTKKL